MREIEHLREVPLTLIKEKMSLFLSGQNTPITRKTENTAGL